MASLSLSFFPHLSSSLSLFLSFALSLLLSLSHNAHTENLPHWFNLTKIFWSIHVPCPNTLANVPLFDLVYKCSAFSNIKYLYKCPKCSWLKIRTHTHAWIDSFSDAAETSFYQMPEEEIVPLRKQIDFEKKQLPTWCQVAADPNCTV